MSTLLLALLAPAYAISPLVNGDLEDGTLSPWISWGAGTQATQAAASSGAWSAQLQLDGATDGFQESGLYQDVMYTWTEAEDIQLTGWFSTPIAGPLSGDGTIALRLEFLTSELATLSSISQSVPLPSDASWTWAKIRATVPSGTARVRAVVVVNGFGLGDSGTAYVDDLRLTAGAYDYCADIPGDQELGPDGDYGVACDLCPGTFTFDNTDRDGDGVGGGCDACRGDNNTGDTDADGVCDDLDLCDSTVTDCEDTGATRDTADSGASWDSATSDSATTDSATSATGDSATSDSALGGASDTASDTGLDVGSDRSSDSDAGSDSASDADSDVVVLPPTDTATSWTDTDSASLWGSDSGPLWDSGRDSGGDSGWAWGDTGFGGDSGDTGGLGSDWPWGDTSGAGSDSGLWATSDSAGDTASWTGGSDSGSNWGLSDSDLWGGSGSDSGLLWGSDSGSWALTDSAGVWSSDSAAGTDATDVSPTDAATDADTDTDADADSDADADADTDADSDADTDALPTDTTDDPTKDGGCSGCASTGGGSPLLAGAAALVAIVRRRRARG